MQDLEAQSEQRFRQIESLLDKTLGDVAGSIEPVNDPIPELPADKFQGHERKKCGGITQANCLKGWQTSLERRKLRRRIWEKLNKLAEHVLDKALSTSANGDYRVNALRLALKVIEHPEREKWMRQNLLVQVRREIKGGGVGRRGRKTSQKKKEILDRFLEDGEDSSQAS